MTSIPHSLKVSVAMTTYNGQRYVSQQLLSMADQTRPPDEIVIGDDQSTDNTYELVKEFTYLHPHIAVRFERNTTRLGSTSNFERVVRRCQGDVVVFSDQDDLWKPTRVARVLELFGDRPDAAYIFVNGDLIDETGQRLSGSLFDSIDFTVEERDQYRTGRGLDILLRHNVVTGAAFAVRRQHLLKVLPFQTNWLHDYYMAFMLEATVGGIVLDEALIQYRCHSLQQVGVAASGSFTKLLAYARMQNEVYCRQDARNFKVLCDRLAASGLVTNSVYLSALTEKAVFFEVRALMRSKPHMALLLIWRNWRNGNYMKYTLGYKQVVVDLVATLLVLLRQDQRI